ncbi:MAG: hypothetical protein KME32_05790 [Mojavia pulchra JT2-VF2]|uniref:Uncharacterized protein n=1 Tax=Mojavia pulchra JT2-VF2 TaxID=287848 RepID=A0A951PVN0_9NOST|nr:hypothetical protein [Mojavia pulchra JT2-VF2]
MSRLNPGKVSFEYQITSDNGGFHDDHAQIPLFYMMAIVKISINLCRFVRSIRVSDICAKWSLYGDFGLELNRLWLCFTLRMRISFLAIAHSECSRCWPFQSVQSVIVSPQAAKHNSSPHPSASLSVTLCQNLDAFALASPTF